MYIFPVKTGRKEHLAKAGCWSNTIEPILSYSLWIFGCRYSRTKQLYIFSITCKDNIIFQIDYVIYSLPIYFWQLTIKYIQWFDSFYELYEPFLENVIILSLNRNSPNTIILLWELFLPSLELYYLDWWLDIKSNLLILAQS